VGYFGPPGSGSDPADKNEGGSATLIHIRNILKIKSRAKMKYSKNYLQRISSLCVWNMIDIAAHALTATAWAEYDPFTFCFTFKAGVDNVLECRRCILRATI
jgi:hypothetical protein